MVVPRNAWLMFSLGAIITVMPFSVVADSATEAPGSRYTLERDGDDFIRLDKQTGQTSLCRLRGGELVCRLAADERDALIDEVSRLQDRVDELEARIFEAEKGGLALDRETDPEASDRRAQRRNEWSHDEMTDEEIDGEFERALDYSTRALRRFFEVMKELRQDLNRES